MELLQQVGEQAHALISAHPILYTLFVVPASMWLVSKAESKIPAIVDWAEDYQDRALRRAGVPEEAIILIDERELKDMRAAADAFEKEIAERKAKLTSTPAA